VEEGSASKVALVTLEFIKGVTFGYRGLAEREKSLPWGYLASMTTKEDNCQIGSLGPKKCVFFVCFLGEKEIHRLARVKAADSNSTLKDVRCKGNPASIFQFPWTWQFGKLCPGLDVGIALDTTAVRSYKN